MRCVGFQQQADEHREAVAADLLVEDGDRFGLDVPGVPPLPGHPLCERRHQGRYVDHWFAADGVSTSSNQ